MSWLASLHMLEDRQRSVHSAEVELQPMGVPGTINSWVMHPSAVRDLLEGDLGPVPIGLEMGLLAACIDKGILPNRLWPGSLSIMRYDLLQGTVSAGLVKMPDGRLCLLGFVQKPGAN